MATGIERGFGGKAGCEAMDEQGKESVQQPKVSQRRPSGPILVGVFFALVAVILTVVGLWREDNLSLRNAVLGIVVGGGSWGLISWAVASAAAQVEEDVASERSNNG